MITHLLNNYLTKWIPLNFSNLHYHVIIFVHILTVIPWVELQPYIWWHGKHEHVCTHKWPYIGKGHILEQPSPKYPAGHSTISDVGQKTNVTYSVMQSCKRWYYKLSWKFIKKKNQMIHSYSKSSIIWLY